MVHLTHNVPAVYEGKSIWELRFVLWFSKLPPDVVSHYAVLARCPNSSNLRLATFVDVFEGNRRVDLSFDDIVTTLTYLLNRLDYKLDAKIPESV